MNKDSQTLPIPNFSSSTFLIEGVRCSKCIQKLENLPVEQNEIIESRFSQGNSTLTIKKQSHGLTSQELIDLIEAKGFKASLIQDKSEINEAEKKVQRSWLTRLVVTFAITGNIMMFSAAVYTGADGQWNELFRWLSAGFFLVIAFYSVIPFYTSALAAAKERRFTADVALVIAFFWGSLFSYVNLFRGRDEIFFDSTASFVFLILLTRYLLYRVKKKNAVDLNSDLIFGSQRTYFVQTESGLQKIDYLNIEKDHIVTIQKNQTCPVDGTLISPNIAYVNSAFFSGEGDPIALSKNQMMRAGQVNLTEDVQICAKNSFSKSDIGQIFAQLRAKLNEKTNAMANAEIWTKYLLTTVSTLAVVTLIYFSFIGEFETGFQRALAVFTIACPCALSFAIPLASTRTLSLAARNGLLVKSPLFFENLAKVRQIVFDKTGTLTFGNLSISKLDWMTPENKDELAILLSLTKMSTHPLSQTVADELNKTNFHSVELSHYKEIPGIGVSGQINGTEYSIRPISETSKNFTLHSGPGFSFFKGKDHLLDVLFADTLRPEAPDVIANLKQMGFEISIATGDRASSAQKIADYTGISKIAANLNPQEKVKLVLEKPALIIGDGHNDSLAMSQAQCSLAIGGASSTSLAAAQAYTTHQDLGVIDLSFRYAMFYQKLVRQNLVLSLGYNFLSGSAALLGFISPLAAAILMPINSFIVISATLIRKEPKEILFREGFSKTKKEVF